MSLGQILCKGRGKFCLLPLPLPSVSRLFMLTLKVPLLDTQYFDMNKDIGHFLFELNKRFSLKVGNPQDAFLLEPELLLSFFKQDSECFMAQVVCWDDKPLHFLPDVDCKEPLPDSIARCPSCGNVIEGECPLEEVFKNQPLMRRQFKVYAFCG